MRLTDTFKLPEPEGEDFGNCALQLQVLAEAMDTYLWNLQRSFNGNLRTAAVVGHATSTYTVPVGQTLLPFDGDANALTLGGFVVDYQNGFTNVFTIPEQGSYMFGGSMQLIAGTPNVNTLRTIQIAASVPSGPQFTSQKQYLFNETALEPNNGQGVYLSVAGQFDYQAVPNARPLRLWMGFSHQNTSSSVVMQGNVNTCFWAIKISEIGS